MGSKNKQQSDSVPRANIYGMKYIQESDENGLGGTIYLQERVIQRLASYPTLTSFEAAETVAKAVVWMVGRETFVNWGDWFSRRTQDTTSPASILERPLTLVVASMTCWTSVMSSLLGESA
jgi:hypothetical protein